MNRCDVLVIGGGIHGAGVAQAAAAAGYSVQVVEKATVGSGTSSRSSKLIHGGLRYLESGRFSLVRECLRERAILLENAPGLVHLEDFYLPVYYNTRRRPATIRTGLILYSLLAGLRADTGFSKVPKVEWGLLDGLESKGLQAVYRYPDAQTDDIELTRAVMRSAQSLGTVLSEDTEVTAMVRNDTGFRVSVCAGGDTSEIDAQVVVNAAGPWVNRVLERMRPAPPKQDVELVAGTHIIIPARLTKGVYYLESPDDGRAVFAMPWKGRVMVGTTERSFNGSPDDIAPTQGEIDYLKKTWWHYFPTGPADRDEVPEAFSGLRVLPAGSGRAFDRSRETVLFSDKRSGALLTIYGGKLTAYRATAEQVLNHIRHWLPSRVPRADVKILKLHSDAAGGKI